MAHGAKSENVAKNEASCKPHDHESLAYPFLARSVSIKLTSLADLRCCSRQSLHPLSLCKKRARHISRRKGIELEIAPQLPQYMEKEGKGGLTSELLRDYGHPVAC